eukprot:TRINITY_DN18527_c0_g1_i1.p1 TRINITY_DN18527_c0_g1~~TRINITY_DN18527_c0_g1_i1.p1  ORF type:complete len:1522 (+),score=438.66 TRINITY_DN18527_c0_g1_i1:110-4567(+)
MAAAAAAHSDPLADPQPHWRLRRVRKTAHIVVECIADGAPPKSVGRHFIVSSLGWRQDTQLISICPLTGALSCLFAPGHDNFPSQGAAMTHLAEARGYRVKRVLEAVGVIGATVVGGTVSLCFIVSAEPRMVLPFGAEIMTVTDVQWVSLALLRHPGTPPEKAALESNHHALVTGFTISGLHFYSEDCDVTRPISPGVAESDDEWRWNTALAGPFIDAGLSEHCVVLAQGTAIGSTVPGYPLGDWDERIKRFYAQHNPEKEDVGAILERYRGREELLLQKLTSKYGPEKKEDIFVGLVTRRSKKHPGTRYNVRGIDGAGAPANEIECELFAAVAEGPHQGEWASHILRRGSVPLRWKSELAGKLAVGQATFVIQDDPFKGTDVYFEHLQQRFGVPVACMSLLQIDPEHAEFALAEHFQEAITALAKTRPDLSVVKHKYDWHGMVRRLGLPVAVQGFWTVISQQMQAGGVYGGNWRVEGDAPAPFKDDRKCTSPHQSPKKGAFGKIRGLVSMQKIRYQEGGFDLDLTYITPRLIAMGFPSHGAEGYYRNPVDEVERFFRQKHEGHYRIYNLCSEREYDSGERFGGAYRRWPFDDHNAPAPLSMLSDIVSDAKDWMDAHPDNVIATHCKAGKGRTGVVLCCLLMCGYEPSVLPAGTSAAEALAYFSSARTKDGLGVTIPSQRRYVGYFETMISRFRGLPPPPRPLRLLKVIVQSPVKVSGAAPWLYFMVHSGPKHLHTKVGCQEVMRGPSEKLFDSRSRRESSPAGRFTVFDLSEGGQPPTIRGDIKMTFMSSRKLRGDEEMFHLWFYTSFVPPGPEPLRFVKHELDKACKDEHHKSYRRDLQVELYFEEGSDEAAAASEAAGQPEPSEPESAPAAVSNDSVTQAADCAAGGSCEGAEVVATLEERQRALIRLNCVDSLDRTNLASFFVSMQVLAELRRRLCKEGGSSFNTFGKTVAEMWQYLGDDLVSALAEAFVANGDVCSLLYTNTPATHTDAIREFSPRLGKAKGNTTLTLMRRYQNTMLDAARNDSFLALLGLRVPAPTDRMSVLPSVVLSAPPFLDGSCPDATPLFESPSAGGDMWCAPPGCEIQVVAALPAPCEVCEIALCFRLDGAGGNIGFPAAFTVCVGTHLDTLRPVLPDAVIPRAADSVWMGFPVRKEDQTSDRFVRLSFGGSLARRYPLFLGGMRVLGRCAQRQQPPSFDGEDNLARWPAACVAVQVPTAEGSPAPDAVLEGHPEAGEWTAAASGAVELVVLLSCLAVAREVRVDSACPVTATVHSGRVLSDPRVSVGKLTDEFTCAAEGVAVDGAAAIPLAPEPVRAVIITLVPAEGVPVRLRSVSVIGRAVPNPCRLPALPPATQIGCRASACKVARAVLQGQDDDVGAAFILIQETKLSVGGIRIVTCDRAAQAPMVRVSVARVAGLTHIPSEAARTATFDTNEDFVVPSCASGTTLDFRLRCPAEGTLVRVLAPSGVASARTCIVLLSDD